MIKDSLQIKDMSGRTVGFSEFWQLIASELGNSRLKVNLKADSIKYFLDAESDHRAFLRNIIHQSYKRCHCYHLKARFDVNIALDILGETSYKLQGSKEDDLLDIELLEEIAWLVSRHYSQLIKMPESALKSDKKGTHNASENGIAKSRPIVSLSKLKIQRANQRL